MSPSELASLLAIFTVALLHTLIPSHWLCFVLVAKANKWPLIKLISVTMLAASFHLLITLGLGFGAAAGISKIASEHTLKNISTGLLLGVGVIYIFLHFTKIGHTHGKDEHVVDGFSIIPLVISMTVSPCAIVIPVLFGNSPRDPVFMVILSLVLVVTTIGTMLILVSLSYLGIERIKFHFIEKYERFLVGIILCALGTVGHLVHNCQDCCPHP